MQQTIRIFAQAARAGQRHILPKVATVLVAGVLGSTAWAEADCQGPETPSMPDGATATLEQMLEGQKSVKAFQAANMDYMKCLDAHAQAAGAEAKSAGDADAKAVATAEQSETLEAYNAAVSAEEEVAGQFNIELREYKAANK